ncbi:transglutaminase-like domain-containing protein [Candidatus Uabimicrobium sp. HlEnr_7]|uniref:transglutaminase-like domain-containing protein n=1 Tax=Candidatus Uabimicrobium helgolandensis TaxID=3095367 RepID=UPI00355808CD
MQIVKMPRGSKAVTDFTLPTIWKLAFMASYMPDIVRLSRKIILGANSSIYRSEEKANALFNYVKNNFDFFPDPSTVEYIKRPDHFLRDGFGDCDDFLAILASLNMACGNKCRLVAIAMNDERRLNHVYLEVWTGKFWKAYDASLRLATPGWHYNHLKKVVFSPKNYDPFVGGFFDSIFDEIKRFARNLEKQVIRKTFRELKRFGRKAVPSKIYEELKRFESSVRNEIKRVARNIRDEIERLNERIKKEFARWERELGMFGKFLVVGIKGLALSSPLTFALSVGSLDAFKMSTDEFLILAKLGLTIASIVLSIVSAGATSALVAGSIMELANAAVSVVQVTRAIDERKEIIKDLKRLKAVADVEIRAKRETIKQLESQIILAERIKQKKIDYQKRIELMKLNHQKKIQSIIGAP